MERRASDEVKNIRIINTDTSCTVTEDMFDSVCNCVLVWWTDKKNVSMCIGSRNHEIRALELADYLAGEYGYVKGDRNVAYAVLSEKIFEALLADSEISRGQEYFIKKADSYFNECKWIYSSDYIKSFDGYEKYVKKKEVWAFVRTTDIASEGKKLRIRSLENESGAVITASEDSYIMIGCRGEIYDINRDKFENTYSVTDEGLDIFDRMLDFLPEVMEEDTGNCIAIDEKARLCYPRNDRAIYARKLEERTKVFPAGGSDYYVGRKGDYLAVREDDPKDVYVIQKNIFGQTYEKSC